jgi:phosphate transport system substrate-binding protein
LCKKFSKKWLVVAASLLLVAALFLNACSSAATTTTTTSNPINTTTAAVPPTTTSTSVNTTTNPPTTTTSTTTTTTTPTVTTTTKPPTTTTTTPLPIVALNGAGGTFPAPLYTKWFSQYATLTGIQINYNAVGSGAGINAITNGTVDFGASDAIMSDAQITAAQAAYGPVLNIPTTMGPVAVIVGLATLNQGQQLKLTGDLLAKIYLKTITYWDDQALTAINPGIYLPHIPIAVVHRSDSSGTSYIFTNYLSKVNQQWSTQIGFGTTVVWPGDIGGTGSAGVASYVKQVNGSIGYVELAYAIQNNIPYAQMQNSSGNYITPSLASASAAADGVALPANMLVMITNSSNPTAYPIVGFTWLIVYVNQTNQAKGQELVDMLWWAIHDGQQYNAALTYPSLPAAAVAIAEAQINSIKYNGVQLHH